MLFQSAQFWIIESLSKQIYSFLWLTAYTIPFTWHLNWSTGTPECTWHTSQYLIFLLLNFIRRAISNYSCIVLYGHLHQAEHYSVTFVKFIIESNFWIMFSLLNLMNNGYAITLMKHLALFPGRYWQRESQYSSGDPSTASSKKRYEQQESYTMCRLLQENWSRVNVRMQVTRRIQIFYFNCGGFLTLIH